VSNREVLVRDEVTRYGQHWMEILCMEGSVDRDRWIEQVPFAALHLAKMGERHEAALGTHRLYLWWPAREVVRLDKHLAAKLGTNEAVLWYIDAKMGETIRSATYNAAAEFWCCCHKQWPDRVFIQKRPVGAPDRFHLVDCPEVCLTVEEAVWVPKGFVLVARRPA
jgi:hypothetical protein